MSDPKCGHMCEIILSVNLQPWLDHAVVLFKRYKHNVLHIQIIAKTSLPLTHFGGRSKFSQTLTQTFLFETTLTEEKYQSLKTIYSPGVSLNYI